MNSGRKKTLFNTYSGQIRFAFTEDLGIFAVSATVLDTPGYDQKRQHLFHYLPENRATVYLLRRSQTSTNAQKPPKNGNGVAQSAHSIQAIYLAMVRTLHPGPEWGYREKRKGPDSSRLDRARVALRKDFTRLSCIRRLNQNGLYREGKGVSYV